MWWAHVVRLGNGGTTTTIGGPSKEVTETSAASIVVPKGQVQATGKEVFIPAIPLRQFSRFVILLLYRQLKQRIINSSTSRLSMSILTRLWDMT